MQIDTNLISWGVTIIAAVGAVYFNYRASHRADNQERRADDLDLLANLKAVMDSYSQRLETLTKERDEAQSEIVNLRKQIAVMDERLRDLRLDVFELSDMVVKLNQQQIARVTDAANKS